MSDKKILRIFWAILGILVLAAGIFLFSKASLAVSNDMFAGDAEGFRETVGLSDDSLSMIIGRIINIVLSVLGVVLVVLIIYAGIKWMTATDEKGVGDAKKILINAIVGLLIIVSAWAITSFIVGALNKATGEGDFSGGGYSGGSVFGGSSGTLRGGALGKIIQTHYPSRDALDVPRNSKIFVSFFDEIDINSVRDSSGNVKLDSVKIYALGEGSDWTVGQDSALSNVQVEISDDKRTLRFTPAEYLGSATESVRYVVWLGSDILRSSGSPIFNSGEFYYWQFSTATIIDTVAPRVLEVSPVDPSGGCLGGCHPRNKMIQVRFNEAIDPLTVSGNTVNGFNNLLVGQGLNVEGIWSSANNYQVAVFTPNSQCDGVTVNSCGDPVYCLPAASTFNNKIKSAALLENGQFSALFPYDGVVDLAGNSLDGNANGVADGQDADSYSWQFTTNNELRVTPPRIVSMVPGLDSENVSADTNIEITFSSPLLASSIAKGVQVFEGTYDSSGMVRSSFLWNGPQRISLLNNNNNILVWEHFLPLNVAAEGQPSIIYVPQVLSSLKDDCQNCFLPAGGPGCTTNDWLDGPWNEGNGVFPNCTMQQD
ncbi:MAG TPA: Ig-like domain-containing protein [bacterium]|nr:Ig-like domain-containing protein [bacterium]